MTQTPRLQARYQGQVIGWFDTQDEAEAAIEAARQADAESDADFDRMYNPNR